MCLVDKCSRPRSRGQFRSSPLNLKASWSEGSSLKWGSVMQCKERSCTKRLSIAFHSRDFLNSTGSKFTASSVLPWHCVPISTVFKLSQIAPGNNRAAFFMSFLSYEYEPNILRMSPCGPLPHLRIISRRSAFENMRICPAISAKFENKTLTAALLCAGSCV